MKPSPGQPVTNQSTAAAASVQVVPRGAVHGSVRPPGSKSITNRALVCAAFAAGQSTLSGALRSDDTEVMIAALRAIGVGVDVRDGGRTLSINTAGRSRPDHEDTVVELFVGNSGTTIRFLTAALSAAGGHYRLYGVPRMHQRPIADLVEALQRVQTGSIETQSPGGCPPVLIQSSGWRTENIEVAGNVSSQYLSGLMMAAPIANLRGERQRRRMDVMGELVSKPYVEMTCAVMNAFAAEARLIKNNSAVSVDIAPSIYQSRDYEIEPDASAASYFWAAAAITGGSVSVEGLTRDAMQGDVGFCEVLKSMGCTVDYQAGSITVSGRAARGVDVDMNRISDTVQTLAVVALFADAPTRVRGVAHNRFKETDRIGDLATELRKLGAKVDEHEDGLTIFPLADDKLPSGVTLETYDDHRMAMSFALVGLRLADVSILNPSCTAKTYPEFFADLETLIGRAHKWA